MTPDRPQTTALTIGLVLIITMFAIDLLAIVAAMPVIESDIGGRQWYGAVFSMFVLANIVGIVATGLVIGRYAFTTLLSFGLAVFAVGLALGAAAPSMFALALTRTIQGAGAGVLATVTYAIVASRYDDQARPKVLAAISSAWVIPSLVAPAGAAWIAEQFHWRWVFGVLLILIVPATLLTVPRLRSVPTPAREAARPGHLRASLAVAASVVILQVGLANTRWTIVVLAGVVGGGWLMRSLATLLPKGSLTGTGVIGGAMLSKLLAGLVFIGTDSFIPLALTDIHGYSATAAGLTLTASALTWTAGSWTVAHQHDKWSERSMNRIGHLILATGVAGTLLIATEIRSGLIIALVTWAVAGYGVGLVFGSVNVVALRDAPEGAVGSVSSSLQLADVIGFAIASGVGGVLIAVGERNAWHPGSPLLILWGGLASIALFAAIVAARDLPAKVKPA